MALKTPHVPDAPAASPFSLTAKATPSGSPETIESSWMRGSDHGKSLNQTTGLNSYFCADVGGPGQVVSLVVFSDEPTITPKGLICQACPLTPLLPLSSRSVGSAVI